MNIQTELQFLLSQEWKLVGVNIVLSPDGCIRTDDIIRAAHWWRIKIDIQKQIEIDRQNRRTIY